MEMISAPLLKVETRWFVNGYVFPDIHDIENCASVQITRWFQSAYDVDTRRDLSRNNAAVNKLLVRGKRNYRFSVHARPRFEYRWYIHIDVTIPFRSFSSGRAGFKRLRQRRVERFTSTSLQRRLCLLESREETKKERERLVRKLFRLLAIHVLKTYVYQSHVHARVRETARRHVCFLLASKSIAHDGLCSRKFRGQVCGGPSFLKLVASILSASHYRDDASKDDEATNNQHFPISVNLARSFNGKRRRCRRSAFPREWNGYVDTRWQGQSR